MTLPCGKCRSCRIAKSSEWSIRLMHETDDHKYSTFATLTYDEEHLPVDGVLVKSDLQKFIKRLRRDLEYEKRNIKYYAAGEYGETYVRPHYHAILFGIHPVKDKKLIEENWSFGMVHTGTVTPESCRYVCDYFNKDDRREKFPCGVLPFKVQSNGLGKSFIRNNELNMVANGFISENGIKRAIPRYYKSKIELQGLEYIAKEKKEEILNEYLEKYERKDIGKRHYESQIQKEKNIKARQGLKNKGKL